MGKIRFSTGDEVRVKGDNDRYRYVKHNVVRSITTGRCKGVDPAKIKRKRKSVVELFRSIFVC